MNPTSPRSSNFDIRGPRRRNKGPKQGREGIKEEEEESSLATRLLLDHHRTSAQPPTDAELLTSHRPTPDFYPTTHRRRTYTRSPIDPELLSIH
ncbi:hypothetical protein M5K25_019522 [Dendrobium thyrsiflorum]|uniref:Uncharacterized protein n=1 Tax=Dendrobium thyrsiflorum TaxID=117978 RepID=A0ABD0UFM3_DENTH